MNISLILVCLWALVANVIAMMPTRDAHWTSAYVLIGLGLPLLVFVVWENGFWIGVLVFAAGASVLRWPVIYLARWLRRVVGR